MNDKQVQIYGRGVYPIRTAARPAHLDPETARRGVEGYEYGYRGERRRSAPITFLAKAKAKASEDGPLLDFEQLLTLLLVKAFKDRGLSLSTIKRAAAKAQQDYPTLFVAPCIHYG